jgi:hypothetical protein
MKKRGGGPKTPPWPAAPSASEWPITRAWRTWAGLGVQKKPRGAKRLPQRALEACFLAARFWPRLRLEGAPLRIADPSPGRGGLGPGGLELPVLALHSILRVPGSGTAPPCQKQKPDQARESLADRRERRPEEGLCRGIKRRRSRLGDRDREAQGGVSHKRFWRKLSQGRKKR